MRFEVRAAVAMGVLLPALESYRRGLWYWRLEFTTMFEDYLAGVLLLVGAWAAFRSRQWAPRFLLVAWAWVTGMMTTSLIDQIEVTLREGSPEPDNAVVIGAKVTLLAVSAWALVSTFRDSARDA